MGLSKNYSAIVGVPDLVYLVQAFEELNKVVLTITLSVVMRGSGPDFLMIVSAYTPMNADAAPVPLACEDFYLRALNCQTMESAIILALYKLDAALVRLELEGTKEQKA